MRALTSKCEDLISKFDKIDESEAEIENTTLHHHLINNHHLASNEVKIKAQLPSEPILGFCRTFKKITTQLRIHSKLLIYKISVTQYTVMSKVNFEILLLFVTIFIPHAQAQLMFNDSNNNSVTLSFDSRYTAGKIVDTQLKCHVNNGSAQNINSPKCLIVAHQTADRIKAPNKTRKIAVSDILNVRKFHVNIGG